VDLPEWMATRLAIETRAGELVPYRPKPAQAKLDALLSAQATRGLPGRLIVLKARRLGVSTWTQGMFYSLAHLQPRRHGYTVAHREDSSEYLLEMAHGFDRHLPDAERLPKARSNPGEIIWAPPHDSRLEMHTAGRINVGSEASLARGREIHYLHASEVAFWDSAASTLRAILQAVSGDPGTIVIIESTANGAAGEYYERWRAAVEEMRSKGKRSRGYWPVFLSWLTAAEYALSLHQGEDLGNLTEEEERLRGLGATPEQLNWRRQKVANDFNGDEDRFRQEYPATPDEAFVTSGRPAIPASIIRRHEKLQCPPRRTVALDVDPVLKVRDVLPDSPRAWHVWREPQEHHDYIVFGDVAEGSLSDASDPRSEPDFCAGVVLDRRELAIVATLRARIDPDLFGEELLAAARWYNAAWASPESNAAGVATVLTFVRRNYQHLYQRQRAPENIAAGEDAPLWGWKTTGGNRDLMIDSYLALCRPDPPGDIWDGKLAVYDPRIVAEERTFVWRGSKRQHQAGAHDDLLFACFGAVQLHQACPRQFAMSAMPHQPIGVAGLDFDRDYDDEDRPQDWRTG